MALGSHVAAYPLDSIGAAVVSPPPQVQGEGTWTSPFSGGRAKACVTLLAARHLLGQGQPPAQRRWGWRWGWGRGDPQSNKSLVALVFLGPRERGARGSWLIDPRGRPLFLYFTQGS